MADRSITFTLLGKADSAVKAFGQVERSVDGLHGKLGKVAAAAGAAFAGIGVAIAKTGFDELKDAQAGAAQLAAGIKSTGGAANVSVDQLEKLATSIQNYSGQTDDSIVDSEKLLLTFTNIKNAAGANNDIFTQATQLTADMAARMGTDASSAAIQLGKALNDPVGQISALTRVGVSFTDAQKKQIAAMVDSGDTIGAQKVILGELNKEFGGSAKAAGQTLPGQLARAKRSFEDVSQSIMEKLLPAATNAFGFVQNNMGWIGPLAIGLGAVAGAIVAVNAATTAWTAVTKAFTVAQEGENAALLANPIGITIAAIAALVAGIVIAYKKSETFRDIVKAAFGAVKDAVQAVVDFFVKDVPAGIQKVIDWFKDHWPLLLGILTGPFGLAVGEIVKHRDQIVHFFEEIGPKLVSALARVGDILLAPFKAGFSAVAHLWNDTVGKLHFGIPDWVPVIGGKEFSMPKIPEFANGGTVRAAGVALVGEEGPELVRLPAGAHVFPTDRTLQALQGRSVANVNAPELHVHFDGPVIGGSRADARQLAGFLKDELRRIAVFQQRVGHPDAAAFATAFGV